MAASTVLYAIRLGLCTFLHGRVHGSLLAACDGKGMSSAIDMVDTDILFVCCRAGHWLCCLRRLGHQDPCHTQVALRFVEQAWPGYQVHAGAPYFLSVQL